jgi:protein subunit release factor A
MGKKLLFSVTIDDCRVDTFTVGGAGGGGKDTSSTGVRVTHEASGASAIATETRSQFKNKVQAFKRMAATKEFKAWHRIETARRMGAKSVDELVDEAMQPHNIKTEVHDEQGRWVPSQSL